MNCGLKSVFGRGGDPLGTWLSIGYIVVAAVRTLEGFDFPVVGTDTASLLVTHEELRVRYDAVRSPDSAADDRDDPTEPVLAGAIPVFTLGERTRTHTTGLARPSRPLRRGSSADSGSRSVCLPVRLRRTVSRRPRLSVSRTSAETTIDVTVVCL
jgi:hypothetical protein